MVAVESDNRHSSVVGVIGMLLASFTLIAIDTKLLPRRGGVAVGVPLPRLLWMRSYDTGADEMMKIGDKKAEQGAPDCIGALTSSVPAMAS